jgi:phosphoribosylformylglycinamidine synthase
MEISLTQEERRQVRKRLGREPNELEWAMISVEWSEHCSYKSSKRWLKLFPTQAKHVLVGPGYDSGIIDLGDGLILAAHIESHNHPSAIDPYGGAATGIGGIVRDVLCVGARPIALLDCLRFGEIEKDSHSRWLFKEVVRGIADYGNCIGIPTLAGEIEFDKSFSKNCLVDVACIGIGRRKDLVLARAEQEGSKIFLIGGSTGRDGIYGVTFASRALGEDIERDRPAVQIPDPFLKKLIIEATLEAISKGYLAGAKDLGGGGLACALSEIAHKGGKGVEIELSKIHLREPDMNPVEIMISESQERMLLVVKRGKEEGLRKVLEKYEIPYSEIGRVISSKDVVVKLKGKEIARIPARVLANAPLILRRFKKPDHLKNLENPKIFPPKQISKVILRLLSSPTIASKAWVYQQYDHEVGIRTILRPGEGDAAVLRLPNEKFIALKADCNSLHCYLDPYWGAASNVAEACRNVACVGARPVAMLDHCQFGDPGKEEVFWCFKESVRGIAHACKAFGIPCIGGKVSFYNEDSRGRAIKPTPLVMVIGLIEKAKQITQAAFRKGEIAVVGKTKAEFGGSEYLKRIHSLIKGRIPKLDLKLERRTFEAVLKAIRLGLIKACHDCSRGGLAIALAEMCVLGNKGARIDLNSIPRDGKLATHELLFSESNSRFIICTQKGESLKELFEKGGIPFSLVGKVEGKELIFEGKERISCNLDKLRDAYLNSIPRLME